MQGRIVTHYLWTTGPTETRSAHGVLFKGHRVIVPEKPCNRTLQTMHKGYYALDAMQLRAGGCYWDWDDTEDGIDLCLVQV